MSCSYYVTFHRKPTDPEWEKKYAAVVALHDAGVSELPKELADYFHHQWADPYEVKDSLKVGEVDVQYEYPRGKKRIDGVERHCDHGRAEVEIDLDKLPKDVRLIKVTISC